MNSVRKDIIEDYTVDNALENCLDIISSNMPHRFHIFSSVRYDDIDKKKFIPIGSTFICPELSPEKFNMFENLKKKGIDTIEHKLSYLGIFAKEHGGPYRFVEIDEEVEKRFNIAKTAAKFGI